MNAFLANPAPLLDVRSPGEYEQAHIPGAKNLPLFSNQERAAVGSCFKREGSKVAVKLGLELVAPRLPELANQLEAEAKNGHLRLYCWRGGMRSSSVAWLAKTVGIDVQLLAGGYKSFRNWALAQFELSWPICLLGGGTGSGKTAVLQALAKRGAAVVDLEKLANHRGSSFGGLGLPKQPSVEHFENCLAIELRGVNGMAPLWLEAESAQVGRCRIPHGIWKQMQLAPLVVLERPKEERIAMLVEVYGSQCPKGLIEATERLSRKLGPQRTATALSSIRNGDLSRACAEILDYYDRSYTSELARRQSSIERLDGGGKSIENIAQLLMELGAA